MELQVYKQEPETMKPVNWSDEIPFVLDFIEINMNHAMTKHDGYIISEWILSKTCFIKNCIRDFAKAWDKYVKIGFTAEKCEISEADMLEYMIKIASFSCSTSIYLRIEKNYIDIEKEEKKVKKTLDK